MVIISMLFTSVSRHREMTWHSVVHFGTLLFCDDLYIWHPCPVSKRGINEALQFVERISRLSLFLAKTYFDTLVYCFVWDVAYITVSYAAHVVNC